MAKKDKETEKTPDIANGKAETETITEAKAEEVKEIKKEKKEFVNAYR